MIRKQIIKRIFVLTLILTFLLSGCSVVKERKIEKEYDLSTPMSDESDFREGRVLKPALYFVQKGTNKLVAELRTMTVGGDESPVKSIVAQLLRGPIDDGLLAVAPEGVAVDFVEVSADIANVYLLSSSEIEPKDRFILKLALANTLTDYLNIKYVEVFINGVADGFEEYPHPLQKKSSGVWTDAYDEILGKHIASEKETDEEQTLSIVIETPLYFLDASGEYILPEVREIGFDNNEYLSKIIGELADGPRNSYVYKPSVSQELELASEHKFYTDESGEVLEIDLKVSPALSGFEKPEKEMMSYAALIYTLTSFYPNLDKVIINIGELRVASIGEGFEISEGIRRSDVNGYLAGGINLYFRVKDSKLLSKVNRMVSQEMVWSASIRLSELMIGPKASEGEETWPCFPSGINSEDILDTRIYKSTLEVDLSHNFMEKCKDLSSEEEMLLIFAMVNTLTDMQGINSVQFLVEGEKTEELAGHLYFGDIFIKNPGLIQTDF